MTTTLFHCLSFEDADAGIAFLTAIGFAEVAVFRNADDPSVVEHAQFRWGDRGAVMFGSVRRDAGADTADAAESEDTEDAAAGTQSGYQRRVGAAACYCVVDTDDEVDAVYARAVAAGAAGVQRPQNPPYGGRDCLVRDAEGNQWSFGSYPGESA